MKTHFGMFEGSELGFWKCLNCGELAEVEEAEEECGEYPPEVLTYTVICPACGRYDRFDGVSPG